MGVFGYILKFTPAQNIMHLAINLQNYKKKSNGEQYSARQLIILGNLRSAIL